MKYRYGQRYKKPFLSSRTATIFAIAGWVVIGLLLFACYAMDNLGGKLW